MSVADQLTDLFKQVIANGFDQIREPEIRPSMQPFCPRRVHFNQTEVVNHTIESDLILDVGNAIHDVIQKWIPQSIPVFGNWICPDTYDNGGCGFETRQPCWHQGPCPRCGKKLLQYVELEILCDLFNTWKIDPETKEWFFHVYRGHCDGLLFIDGKVILIDYKTTRGSRLEYMREPSHAYVMQTTIYARTIQEQFGFDIEEVVIFYVDRDVNLGSFQWKPFGFVPDYKKIDSYIEALRYTEECKREKRLPEWGICWDREHTHYCPHVDKCFTGLTKPPASSNPKLVQVLTGEKHGADTVNMMRKNG